MEFFSKKWLCLICLVSVLSAVTDSVIPKSKTKSAFSFLYAAVLVYAFISPLTNTDLSDLKLNFDFLKNESVSSEFQQSADKTALESAKLGFENVIKEKLFALNIETKKVEAEVERKDESFVLLKAVIEGELSDEQKNIARAEIEKLTPGKVEIIFWGSENG